MAGSTLNVPLFPLPETVFFPHTILPLHVFEPRYKAMVKDALEGENLIGVVQLRPGWHEDYFGAPPLYKVLGVGTITEADRWDDGRYDIVLSGLFRTRILSEVDGLPYRKAEVEVLTDVIPPGREKEVADVHELLVKIFEKLSAALPRDLTILPGTEVGALSPAGLTDVLTSLLVNDAYERQSLLAETDVARRQQLLRVQIQTMFNPHFTDD